VAVSSESILLHTRAAFVTCDMAHVDMYDTTHVHVCGMIHVDMCHTPHFDMCDVTHFDVCDMTHQTATGRQHSRRCGAYVRCGRCASSNASRVSGS